MIVSFSSNTTNNEDKTVWVWDKTVAFKTVFETFSIIFSQHSNFLDFLTLSRQVNKNSFLEVFPLLALNDFVADPIYRMSCKVSNLPKCAGLKISNQTNETLYYTAPL